jgi:hypothetical protein
VRLAGDQQCLVLRHVNPATCAAADPGEAAVVSWEARHAMAFPV